MNSCEATSIVCDAPSRLRQARVLGFDIAVQSHDDLVATLLDAAVHHRPMIAAEMSFTALLHARRRSRRRGLVNQFDLLVPDGLLFRWTLMRTHGCQPRSPALAGRLLVRLCRAAASRGVGTYIVGAAPSLLAQLGRSLLRHAPGLDLRGVESIRSRDLTRASSWQVAARIRASGATLTLVGLDSPLQERLACASRELVGGVHVCLGRTFGDPALATPGSAGRMFSVRRRLVPETLLFRPGAASSRPSFRVP
jgi:UDP-N-acetyl-D-mannosaminuronic acid transferase (WecB/TagA/CpsF family)